MVDPDPQCWLALDEYERIAVVLEYHREAGVDVPGEDTHALLHVVVENQVAMGKEAPTEAVLRRLIDENLDRHDAIHAIACILANHMYEMLHGNNVLSNDEYYAALEQLTAEKWLRGEFSGH
ncbi:MAG: DUF1841 family protein [Gammaproteobacteria bacterium]|nr:DUF1841 family protein [Gammaproteobacteria bacterium]